MTRWQFSLALGAAMTASLAQAEPIKPDALSPRLQISAQSVQVQPAAPVRLAYAQSRMPMGDGVVRTSVEKRFGVRDDAVGEAGFLCGLQPHPDTAGAAAAFGHDPDGRFVGAKLRLSF